MLLTDMGYFLKPIPYNSMGIRSTQTNESAGTIPANLYRDLAPPAEIG